MAFVSVGVLPGAVVLRGRNLTSPLDAAKLRSHTPSVPVRASAGVGASARVRRRQNAEGNIFVDTSCIDCDTCRWLAPETFKRVDGQSAVYQQPAPAEQSLHLALGAAAACPTGSIHSEEDARAALRNASKFPMPVSELMTDKDSVPEELRDVYYLGMTAEETFAASSWVLYLRDINVAIIVDVPRYSTSFAKRVLEFFNAPGSGVDTHWIMVLTHSDDVYNHDKWAKTLSARRYIHHVESNTRQGTDKCEVQLKDEDFPYKLARGVELIHVPGHAVGHIVMLHKPSKTLFTGDHLFKRADGSLMPSPQFTWGSWSELKQSIRETMDIPFLHGFPGHGRHFHFENDAHRHEALQQVVDEM